MARVYAISPLPARDVGLDTRVEARAFRAKAVAAGMSLDEAACHWLTFLPNTGGRGETG